VLNSDQLKTRSNADSLTLEVIPMHRGKKRTVTEDFHNPSSLSSSHFYERTRHKIPSTWTLFASRNKKTRWAVTRWKTKRSRREQKSHGHYPRPAGGRNDIRRETNEERTMKEEIHWTMQKGKIEWYMRQEGRSRKRSTNRKVDRSGDAKTDKKSTNGR